MPTRNNADLASVMGTLAADFEVSLRSAICRHIVDAELARIEAHITPLIEEAVQHIAVPHLTHAIDLWNLSERLEAVVHIQRPQSTHAL